MPRELKDRIGETITTDRGITWLVVAELEKGMSRDRNNGYDNPKPITRRFEVECQGCKTKREATYKNVFATQSVVCHVCEQAINGKTYKKREGSKLVKIGKEDIDKCIKKDGTIDKRSERANKVDYIGTVFKCKFDTFTVLSELDKVLSKNGKNLYRNFLVECHACGTQKEALAASLLAQGVACPKCRTQKRNVKLDLSLPLPDLERKIQIIHEINDIWADMKRMARNGSLNQYLMDKFETKIIFDDETVERFEMDDNDNLDIDGIDVDWEQRINDYLDDN